MRTGPAVAVALALMTAPAGARGLGGSLPPGVPDARSLGWQQITGEVASATDGARYEFFVNPRRQAIYEVVRYRFTRNGREESEKLVWNSPPAAGRGPTCFSQQGDGSWRQLQAGSAEYRDEMITAMRVYNLHRQAVLARLEPSAR